MVVLVTGGSGFIGSAVIRRALALNHSVLNLDCMTYAASKKTNKNPPRPCASGRVEHLDKSPSKQSQIQIL